MKKYLLTTSSLILLIFWPTQAQELPVSAEERISIRERFNTTSESNYLNQLASKRFNLETQGLLMEALDGSVVFADHHSDSIFNPASVIKLATSFAALDRFGPDFHFETSFYAAGEINLKKKTLNGDLVLLATGDPLLSTTNLNQLIREVIKAGITQVTGSLIVTGPFTYASYYTTATATKRLEAQLRRLGIRITGVTKKGGVSGRRLASHMSPRLRDIVFDQNARSSNPIAERLGAAVGGPKSVEDFLVSVVGIPRSEILVGRTSGLDHNRISARATVQLLRHLVLWLNLRNMQPEDIMPVAGLDPGTLSRRFTTDDYRGAVVGKTGTLNVTDGGVSSLAGIMYTRDRGPVLFAIFNTKGTVTTYRQLQDTFLKNMIVELGGMPEINGSSHRLGN